MAYESLISEIDTEQERSTRQEIPLTLFIFLVAVAAIFVLTKLLWNMPWGTGTRQIVVCFCNGMLMSLPILIALWTVLGTLTPLVRIPLATTALVALLATYCGTLLTMRNALPGGTSEIFYLFAGITIGVTIAVHIPLWILRVMNSVVISRKETDSAKTQFSIQQLLATTTVFAVLIPMIQWLATLGDDNQIVGMLFERETLSFCGIFILVMGFYTLLALVIVFLPKLRTWGLIILALAIATLPFVVTPSIQYVTGMFFTWDQLVDAGLNVGAFSVGYLFVMITVLGLYYQIGYRLQRASATV